MSLTASMAVGAIGAYQRYISPHKGYCCAHRVHHGGLSCSEFAKLVIADHGAVWSALPAIRLRFAECRNAYQQLCIAGQAASTQGESEGKRHPCTKQGDTCVNVCTLPCL